MDIDNLKILSNQAMISSTASWVAPGQIRTAMNGIPELAGYLGRMDAAHNGLLRFQVTDGVTPEAAALKAIVTQGLALDTDFNRFARGIDMVLEGNAQLTAGAKTAADLDGLRKRLFPAGLSIIQRTYLEASVEVETAEERLSDKDRALLERVPLVDGTLLAAVTSWFKKGAALGAVEREMAAAQSTQPNPSKATPADALAARNNWIRVVRAILAGLELADTIPESTRACILKPLRDAVAESLSRIPPRDRAGASGRLDRGHRIDIAQ